MLRTILVIFATVIVSIKSATLPRECSVNINGGLGSPQPLYMYENGTTFVQTEPNLSAFRLQRNETIKLFCPSGFRSRGGDGKVIKLNATCLSGDQFKVENKTIQLKQLACSYHPEHKAKVSKQSCPAGDLYEVGFTVEKAWAPLMNICHDSWDSSTKWTHHQLNPSNALHQRSVPRPLFNAANHFKGIQPDKLYKRNVQYQTMVEILKSEELAGELIQYNTELFLSRGHLAAKADFVFASHQLTTFYYVNAAPQWLSFNNGNWLQVEISLKTFVAKRKIYVDVYTGTDGIVSYADVNGKYQPIYLSVEDPKRPRIPVPKIFYKVIVANKLNAGIVLIGVNDPHATLNRIKSEYVICPDISDKVNYITWERKNITAGYSYACTVNEFTKVVKHLPDFSRVTELLL